jgi:hypothetical protein
VSKLVETFTGYRNSCNKPIVGDNVFTQTASMQMVTIKIYILMIYYQNDLEEKAICTWKNFWQKPILKEPSKLG